MRILTTLVTRAHFGSDVVQFIYPPLIAQAFYLIRDPVLNPWGLSALLSLSVVCTLAIPYMLADRPPRWYSPSVLYVWGFYFLLYGFGGLRLIASGNIQPILCATIVFSIVLALNSHDYKLFWIAIAVSSFFKFYFIAFLLIPAIFWIENTFPAPCFYWHSAHVIH